MAVGYVLKMVFGYVLQMGVNTLKAMNTQSTQNTLNVAPNIRLVSRFQNHT
jgi:hypothetical protein